MLATKVACAAAACSACSLASRSASSIDHAVQPAHHARLVAHAGAVFPHPARAAVGVQQPVLDQVRTVFAQRRGDRLGHDRAAGRVDQGAEAAARRAAQEVGGRVAGHALHRVADEHQWLVALDQAAVRNAGDVPDQRAELLFAGAQRLQHRAPLADVGDEAHEAVLVAQARVAERAPDRHRAAVLAQAGHLGAAHRAIELARTQVGQHAVHFRAVGVGHQHAHVLPDDLVAAPAEDLLRRSVEFEDDAVAVHGDGAVHRGGHQRAHPFLAALELEEQLAVAQHAVGGQHEHREGDRDQGDRQRQERAVRRAFGAGRHAADEARRRHRRVVHAGDRAAHHHRRDQQAPLFGQAAQARQAEADPQRQRGQHHRDHDRQGEHQRVVAQLQVHAHAVHAGVMHGADAGADQHAADHQAPAGQALARDQRQRDHRRADRRQVGQDRDRRVVLDPGAQVKGQHADEVHGPDPGAQRQAAGAEHDRALHPAAAGLAGDLQAHVR
jgi:hypothetical protein